MNAGACKHLLNELFAIDGKNIGISYLCISMGASDLSEQPFSYNDLPEGQALFVKQNLGPAFNAAKLKTKIIVYDHNADKISYPLTVTLSGDSVKRNPAYYILAHAAKFVRPGFVRIASNEIEGLPNVAFKTEDGEKVLIVLNESGMLKKFNLFYKGKAVQVVLENGAAGTFVW